MPLEIERRFLVSAEAVTQLMLDMPHGTLLHQGYIFVRPDQASCRVRIAESEAWLTIKSKATGATRREFELPIDITQAREILQTLAIGFPIEKTRYRIPYGKLTWEVDVFHSKNEGLVIAEVELDDELQTVELPPWVGMEITTDHHYSNASLAMHPFTEWSTDEKNARSSPS